MAIWREGFRIVGELIYAGSRLCSTPICQYGEIKCLFGEIICLFGEIISPSGEWVSELSDSSYMPAVAALPYATMVRLNTYLVRPFAYLVRS